MKKMFCAIILLLSSQVLAEDTKAPAVKPEDKPALVPAAPAVVAPAVKPPVAPEKDSLLNAAKKDLQHDKEAIEAAAKATWSKTKEEAHKANVAMHDGAHKVEAKGSEALHKSEGYAKKAEAKIEGWWTSIKATLHRWWTDIKSWF